MTIKGEKILVTGGQGASGFPVARDLAEDNEVHVMARFGDPSGRAQLSAVGVHCLQHDLTESFDDVDDDFTYVYHSAIPSLKPPGFWPESYDIQADTAGRLMERCHDLKSFVFVSSASVYFNPGDGDPLREDQPFGVHALGSDKGFYTFSKIATEATLACIGRRLHVPITVLRMGSPYGPEGGTVVERLERIVKGEEIPIHPNRPNLFRPMYDTDVSKLGIAALEAARVPSLIVNFCGDETVDAEEYCTYMAGLLGTEAQFRYTEEGTYVSLVPDTNFMHEVLGSCDVGWQEGCRMVVEARAWETFQHRAYGFDIAARQAEATGPAAGTS